jgi:TRAP-type C4-dicarboxylate transport system permease small subunit
MGQSLRQGLLDKLTSAIAAFARKIVSICLFAFIVLVMVDVVLRSLFRSGLPGAVEASEYLLIITAFMGVVYTNSVKGHLSVDLVYNWSSPLVKTVLERINYLLLFLFFLVFFWAGWKRAVSALESLETSYFGSYVLPVWFFRWVVPVSCGLICLQIIAEAIKSIKVSNAPREKI